ncbi:MAG: methyltransferase domain-containing protein [Candidatus Thermoplasmatota archaeon]|nr:methyltransferase domain-containing protein [Candidatus Thermoplasmatota archaeon]
MPMKNTCPSCGSQNVSDFYEVKNVPVNSCVLLSSEQKALDFPKGDVILGFCENCGFIFNRVFDQSKVNYSAVYEDQQSFSPTFNVFARGLVTRLIEKHDLQDKRILEIGCGKGDFLSLICELGLNYGIGIDPAFEKNRVKSEVSERMTFIRDYYSERYSGYDADFVCCRHTLEHIPNTAEFVTTVRRAVDDHLNSIVFFELPDMIRVLNELAFWDIYYEHCSYFSLGSLARLFRSCMFEIVDLSKDFDDQYLLLDAKPVNERSVKKHDLEESVKETMDCVNYFEAHCNEKIKMWKDRLHQFQDAGKKVVIWGSGSKCVSFLTTLDVRNEIDFVVDINPYREGMFIPGAAKKIMLPDFLKDYDPDYTIVMNAAYVNEIRRSIDDMGVTTEILTI